MNLSNEDIINSWSDNASVVTAGFEEEGDFSRIHLLNPALFSLLGDVTGKRILDAGCGQGYLSRMLAKKGALVVGVEPAEDLINYAKEREATEKLGITYVTEDLSKWNANEEQFDIVVSNMVFMDIPEYKPAMKNCMDALKPGGIFIFSILHPCFEESVDWTVKQSVETKEYFEQYAVKQFVGHFFHRPLSEYINFVIESGCMITKLVEPQIDREVALTIKKHERNLHVPSFLVVQAKKV